jgi:hypothetical protein
VLTDLQCQGSYGANRYQGVVRVDVWRPRGAIETRTLVPILMRGDMDAIPGLVRYAGQLVDSFGNRVDFEVYLVRGDNGTGGIWLNHQRHREIHADLFVQPGGFTLFPETGGAARFECTV